MSVYASRTEDSGREGRVGERAGLLGDLDLDMERGLARTLIRPPEALDGCDRKSST